MILLLHQVNGRKSALCNALIVVHIIYAWRRKLIQILRNAKNLIDTFQNIWYGIDTETHRVFLKINMMKRSCVP